MKISIEAISEFFINGFVTRCYEKMGSQRRKLDFWTYHFCLLVTDWSWSYPCALFRVDIVTKMAHVWKVILIWWFLVNHLFLLFFSELHFDILFYRFYQTVLIEKIHIWQSHLAGFSLLFTRKHWHILLLQKSSNSHWWTFWILLLLTRLSPLFNVYLL